MINPQSIDVSLLPSVPLDRRAELPTAPCIYFAIDSQGVIQYIGKSVNPKARWAAHHKYSELLSAGGVRIAYLQISDPSLLFPVESALIAWFKPCLNQTNGCSYSSVSMLGLRLRSGKRAEEMAVELNISVSTVRNWDQLATVPRMTPSGIKRLMAVYSCTFEELVKAEQEVIK